MVPLLAKLQPRNKAAIPAYARLAPAWVGLISRASGARSPECIGRDRTSCLVDAAIMHTASRYRTRLEIGFPLVLYFNLFVALGGIAGALFS